MRTSLADVDVVLFVVEAGRYGEDDRAVAALLPPDAPAILVANKSDRLAGPARMLPFLERMSKAHAFAEIVPVSASKARNLGALLKAITPHLPEQPPMFDADALADRSERFLAAELVREKLFRLLGERAAIWLRGEHRPVRGRKGKLRRIHAAIVVEKANHKAIVIGKDGAKLKAVASAARRDMEKLFGGKVFLEVWVKVRPDWTRDGAALRRLGYEHA